MATQNCRQQAGGVKGVGAIEGVRGEGIQLFEADGAGGHVFVLGGGGKNV